jgi:hypothetical protein
MSVANIKEFLEAERAMMPSRSDSAGAHHYRGFGDFVLSHGEGYSPSKLPVEYQPGRMRECFMNASHLAIENRSLTYVEGYAIASFFPVLHGWCVDRDGLVVDPTWQHWKGGIATAYLGVRFSTRLLMRILSVQEHYGLIESPITNYLLLRHPFTDDGAFEAFGAFRSELRRRRRRRAR